MKDRKYCEHCGQAIVVYKHSFTKSLANLLIKIAGHYEPKQFFNIKQDMLDKGFITPNDYTNFSHLKYWDLVDKYFDDKGRVGGTWFLTDRAYRVIKAHEELESFVRVYNNRVIERSMRMVGLSQFVGYYQDRIAWAKAGKPITQCELNFSKKT